MVEDLGLHKSTKFTRKEMAVDKALRSPFFENLEEIGGAYEIKEFNIFLTDPYIPPFVPAMPHSQIHDFLDHH